LLDPDDDGDDNPPPPPLPCPYDTRREYAQSLSEMPMRSCSASNMKSCPIIAFAPRTFPTETSASRYIPGVYVPASSPLSDLRM
jgi:hypothetical protein